MGTRAFVDTNILIYHYDHRDREKQAAALSLMTNDEFDLVLSTQVLSEFFTIATRKLNPTMPISDAIDAVEHIAELEVVPVTRNLVLDATRTAHEHQLSYWDALILETASRAGCDELITEDLAHGSTIRGVRIRNPFSSTEKS